MNRTRTFTIAAILAVALFAFPLQAQRANFGGQYNAASFAYGSSGGPTGLVIDSGNSAVGSQTITLAYGVTSTSDGISFAPITTTTPILVGVGSTQDSVTPSAVSCATPGVYQSCRITATFTYTHGRGERIASGTYGLQEAINYAASHGGGAVGVDSVWASKGGTATMLNAATGASSVSVRDTRGGAAPPYWSLQPTTLTSLAAPAVLDATSVTWTGTTGTWTAAQHFLCVSYVDALGGEGPCSPTYDVTPAANTILNIKSPVASTGAVGWRAYAGASYNAAFLLPITSARCTLTTLESVIPACAIGANASFPAIFVNTTTLRPQAQSPTKNLNLPFPQGHTTYAYRPSFSPPAPFQTHYGPFPAYGALGAAEIAVLGSVNLPAGYLNQIGRSVRVSGKISLGTVNAATLPTLTIALGWQAGTTAGAPVTVCTLAGPAEGAGGDDNLAFSCTMTVNATGAAGTIMPSGWGSLQPANGGAVGQLYTEQAKAAIAALDLTKQNTIFVKYTSTTNATAAPQLLDLHVEPLQ